MLVNSFAISGSSNSSSQFSIKELKPELVAGDLVDEYMACRLAGIMVVDCSLAHFVGGSDLGSDRCRSDRKVFSPTEGNISLNFSMNLS